MQIVQVQNLADKQRLLDGFDTRRGTWLVADLNSKMHIQKILLSRGPILEEDAVLRASELWRKLVLRLFPEWRLISHDLAQTLVARRLADSSYPWAHTPGAVKTLLGYMNQLLPILSHPQGQDLLQPWLETHTESALRWRHWALLAQEQWQWFYQNKLLPAAWCKGLLANAGLEDIWPRHLILDLGVELSFTESDLVKQLAKYTPVTVLQPLRSLDNRYSLKAYEFIQQSQKEVPMLPLRPVQKIMRFRTVVSEVKTCVHWVRQQLESGLKPHEVGVLAPDIEKFWPILSPYFEQEGIAVNKAVMTRLQSYMDFASWLSTLRLRIREISSADLEMHLFSQPKPKVDYEKFQNLLSRIYAPEDLKRMPIVADFLTQDIGVDEKDWGRDQFVMWSLQWWPNLERMEILVDSLQQLFQHTPASVQLQPRHWLEYFEKLSAKMERELKPPDLSGVHCLNLAMAEWSELKAVFILGMSDQNLANTPTTAIHPSEVMQIAQDLGFYLSHPDESPHSWVSRWYLHQAPLNTVLSFSETDLQGEVHSPSRIWLEWAVAQKRPIETVDAAAPTRWDEIQGSHFQTIHSLRQWTAQHAQLIDQTLKVDLNEQPLSPFATGLPYRLSASSLEKYAECPFIFAARKIFKLTEPQVVDLDVDRASEGTLMHGVFEKLLSSAQTNWTEAQLRVVIEQTILDRKIIFAHSELQELIIRQYLKLAQKFLEFEANWRQRFPVTQTKGCEVAVHAKWSLVSNKLVEATSADHGPELLGFIDRVDEGANGARVVLDYKSRGAGLTNFGSWLKNKKFQLGLYALAVERGFTALGRAPVDGAFYFVTHDMNRQKGFAVDTSQAELFAIEDLRYAKMDRASLERFYEQLESEISALLQQMKEGQFAPKPMDYNTCNRCEWSTLCRAPHLN